MLNKRGKTEIPMDAQESHAMIETLSGEVARLQEQKDAITVEIGEYHSNSSKYKEAKLVLDEINRHIEGKKLMLKTLDKEFDENNERNNTLKKENTILEVQMQEKKTVISELENLEKKFSILQSDMETSHNEHESKKKVYQKEIDDMKINIRNINSELSKLLAKI